MADLTDAKKEFWGDLQVDLATKNTAMYLANQRLEDVISTNGRKAHRPIVSNPTIQTYVPHVDITFEAKDATKQTLEVDTFLTAAEDIDITEKLQTPYDLVSHSSQSIRSGLMNKVEQKFLSEVANAGQVIDSSGNTLIQSSNILDILEIAEGKLGAVDATYETAMRALVVGPRTAAKLRRSKSDRESRLGDSVMENGVIGPWQGWTVVQSNNLPWSASLTLATQPTDGDTVTIAGVTFTFKTTLGTTAGNVLIGADAAAARANLKAAVNGAAGSGSTYVELSNANKYMLRRKRGVSISNTTSPLLFTGYGDIGVSETLTAAADVWSAQKQSSIFMVRGAIDLVLQFMDIQITDKEKGFADLVKGIVGCGTKVFADGATQMVRLDQDASQWST